MRSLLAKCLLLSLLPPIVALLAIGCGPQVIYQPASGVVRLAEPVKAYVWTKTKTGWVKSANRVPIPDGFYLLPPPPTTRAAG
jgi:hypothetical protein